ncbi:DNA/RNA non-specific endonuclease [Mycobacteroides abscessus]|uniref:DNA/RNA non-specific endonuclease n=1 Tax=Mycobacteroides abscessus TaxID=36809 RepID=UPI0027E192D8|nr:DNA/RNA non-specific endonuclease [Mycobacteroides abscessus]
MSGYARSTEQRAAVADHRDPARSAPTSQELLHDDPESGNPARSDPGRRIAAFAAGSVAAIGGIAALHGLYRSGDGAAELVGWAGLLLLAMTALGGGIKLAMWGARPVITALFDRAKERLAEPMLAVVAVGAVIVGALGMWWTLRGGYASWWQHLTGESRWSLSLGVGQMLVAVAAGAALFTGGRYVTGLAKDALTDSGLLIERDSSAGKRRAPEGLWHPGLVAALIGGGMGLVLLTAGITPRLYVWITGPDVLPAVAAIVAVLLWAIGSNLGWWKGLAGLWKWATDASHKAAAMSGVVALLMFSAGGLGLGWFTPATVPQAHAQCPPDCGGGSNGSGSYGPDASQFQPPQMPSQMPDYQGGINQPPLDQNSSISIYNTQAPSVSNNGVQGSSGQQGPQQSWDQPAHGTQIPDYQNATPYTQGPGRPNPDFNPGSQGGQANPGSDAGSQGGQPNQGVQQQAPQQPQENPAQQPDQQLQQSDSQRIDDLTRQLQDQQQQQSGQDRQRIDDLTKQLQQQGQQKQNGNQKLPKAPSKDKKQDDKDQQQDRDDQSQNNDLSALLLGAASTRRRKQDDPSQPDQQQPQGPDTQALAQDGAQLGQSLPGDIANTVSDSVNLGQSAGSAAQNFGSAAQAGASLASSAQSGAVNPMDAVALVQGVSGGISDTADAVGSGASIASTWLNNAGQGAQLAADANPQLKPQAEQVQQLTQAGGQVADLTGQVAGGVSHVSGMVNTASSLGTSGMPDTSGATDALSGTATAVNGPGDIPKPTPPTPSQPSSASQLLGNMVGGPQQPTQPASTGNPNAGSLQGILQPPPSADAVQKQLDLVNQAQDRVKQAQSVVDQSAAQVYMSPQNAPGPDDVKRQGQALFDARRELTDQTLALTEMNQRLIDNGQPPIQIPLLPDNVSRQAFPPEPSKAQEFSGAWSEFSKSTYGIVPDIPTDIRTATNFDQASGADKAALALDGMAIVPGLGAIGRGLKGIEGIRGGEAAIRAADDIPLPSKPVGTSVVTDVTKQGGQAVYQGVDNLGRPTGVTARITPDMIRTGSDAMRAPTPPGFGGQAAGHARGHLLANVLGGSGKLSENLVTLINNPVNSPVMRGFEMSVAKAVEGGQIIDYAVTPLYRGAEAMPEAVQIIAKGNGGFDLAVTILNR